jgi:hypothetical protein
MEELDANTKRNTQHTINAMTWQDADDLTNRQHIYALKQLVKDAWISTGVLDKYAIPICFIHNDLACLLSELAITTRSTTTTTLSPELAKTVNDLFDGLLAQIKTIEPRLSEQFQKKIDQQHEVLKREQLKTNVLCVGNGYRMTEIDKRNKNFDVKLAELHEQHRQSMVKFDTLFTLHEQLSEQVLARDKTKSSVPITNDEGITDINREITQLNKCYENTVETLNTMLENATDLRDRVVLLENKQKWWRFKSDMSTLPALLSQLETHREEPE